MHTDILTQSRLTLEYRMDHHQAPNFGRDVLEGLSAVPKRLSPVYFYDKKGSELFEKICNLPEYYLTRTERAILQKHARDIAAYSNGKMVLVELGSGSSAKTRLLIEAFLQKQDELHYLPVDISGTMLEQSAEQLLRDYDNLRVTAEVAEYTVGIQSIAAKHFPQKMVVFLGSNIGNFEPHQAKVFLKMVRGLLNEIDYLLLGTDLKKDVSVLQAAYGDAQGVTAAFNLNLLHRINAELGGQFELEQFSHVCRYNAGEGRMESFLKSKKAQDVHISKLGRSFHFDAGETIYTENSYKYTLEQVESLAAECGLHVANSWQDARGYFSLNLLQPV